MFVKRQTFDRNRKHRQIALELKHFTLTRVLGYQGNMFLLLSLAEWTEKFAAIGPNMRRTGLNIG